MSTPTPDYGEPWRIDQSSALRMASGALILPRVGVISGPRIAACVNALAGIPDPAAHLANLNKELAELREWKRQQLEVESQWDCQKVGKMLGVPIGDHVRPHIEPKIANLNATIEQQAETLKVMNDALKEAHRVLSHDYWNMVRKCPDFADVAELVRKSHDPHA